jgi:peptide/nickel transport system substrate-binding protein
VATLNREPVTMDEAKKAFPYASALGHSSFMVLNNSGAGGYTGPLTDPRTRLAVAYAIDADVVNQRAFQGKGQPGKGVVAPGSKLLKATQGIPYDPAKAKALLEEVKKEKSWDGSVDSKCANQPAANLEACITVEAMLSAVGFKVTANPLPIGPMVASVIVDKKFELVSSWGIIQSEITLYNGFVNVVDGRNPANQSGYKNPDMDAALDQMRAAQGIPAYEAALAKFQEVVNRDNPFVTYAAGEQITIYKPNIHGILWHAGFNELLDKAYIAK